jgi:hypothetical protein
VLGGLVGNTLVDPAGGDHQYCSMDT